MTSYERGYAVGIASDDVPEMPADIAVKEPDRYEWIAGWRAALNQIDPSGRLHNRLAHKAMLLVCWSATKNDGEFLT